MNNESDWVRLLNDFENVLEATRKEDLSTKIDLSNYQGAPHQLASGINELLSVVTGLLGHYAISFKNSSDNLDQIGLGLRKELRVIVTEADNTSESNEDLNQQILVTKNNAAEMVLAIQEISKNTTTAARSASDAALESQKTKEIVNELIESSSKINDITKSISMIAQQTNLLALNATIEAARAGDAGKGFSVVAGEVKELAKETAQATEDVEKIVTGILKSTNSASISINSIADRSDELNESASNIAGAVEEQSVVISGIEDVLNDLLNESQKIGEKMDSVRSNVGTAVEKNDSLTQVAERQLKQSGELSDLVGDLANEDFIPWNESYSVGIKSVDDQHKKLFLYINQLYQHVVTGHQEEIPQLLDQLADYTVYHFDFEEKIFDDVIYPDTARHKNLHTALLNQVTDAIEKFKAGEAEVDFKLLNFLKNWLNIHIKKEDMAYSPFLRSRGIR